MILQKCRDEIIIMIIPLKQMGKITIWNIQTTATATIGGTVSATKI